MRHLNAGKLELTAGIESAYQTGGEVVASGGIATLIGPRGTGKTQLALELTRAHTRDMLALYTPSSTSLVYDGEPKQLGPPKPAPLYTTAMDLFLSIREAFRKEGPSEREQRDQFIAPSLLVIDEVQERGDTAWEDRLLVNIIDRRYGAMRPTILIGNLTKQGLAESLGSSIVSRIRETGTVVECNWPSFRRATG